jgi:hypothetical protein
MTTKQRVADTAVARFVQDKPKHPVDPRVEAIQVGKFVPVEDDSAQPNKKGSPKKERGPPPPRMGYSVPEFCSAHGFSTAHYYGVLKKQGLAPREMKIGNRRIITIEEASRWRAERTADSTA